MTRKQRRTLFIGTCLVVLALSVGLVLFALSGSITFFYSPSDVAEKGLKEGQRFRLGGLVKEGSVKQSEGANVNFAITDGAKDIAVTYKGVLPDLFREGQGVVTEGRLQGDGSFRADKVLAKHDENYMPPEVAAALKDKGVWRGGEETSKKK